MSNTRCSVLYHYQHANDNVPGPEHRPSYCMYRINLLPPPQYSSPFPGHNKLQSPSVCSTQLAASVFP